MIFKIVITIILVVLLGLTYSHWKQFSRINPEYNLVEVQAPLASRDDYLPYFRENTPILFKDHPTELVRSMLMSPLTFQTSLIQQATLQDFYRHSADTLFLSTSEQETVIELCRPDPRYKRAPKEKNTYRAIERIVQTPDKSIKLFLAPQHLLSVPRFWLFRASKPVNVITGHTLFSRLFHAFV